MAVIGGGEQGFKIVIGLKWNKSQCGDGQRRIVQERIKSALNMVNMKNGVYWPKFERRSMDMEGREDTYMMVCI